MENFSKEFLINTKMEDFDDNEYEKELENQIEKTCGFSGYIDKLEMEEKSDEELLNLEKSEIIDFKNYQINKLKAYISSLEKEKEDLIESFKSTTDVFVEQWKENEQKVKGERPVTARIFNDLKINKIKEESQKNEKNMFNTEHVHISLEKKRCANCKQYIESEEFIKHNIECLRKNTSKKCLKCGEVISENQKAEHLEFYRNPNVFKY